MTNKKGTNRKRRNKKAVKVWVRGWGCGLVSFEVVVDGALRLRKAHP
jgi:hypothetical protein